MTLFQKMISTSAPASVILIRLVVGAVFLTEGIQKFMFPSEVGAGRFAKIGIPSPDTMAPSSAVSKLFAVPLSCWAYSRGSPLSH